MKILSQKTLIVFLTFGISVGYAESKLKEYKLEDMTFVDFTRESRHLKKLCQLAMNDEKRTSIQLTISDFINEVEYRCLNVEKTDDGPYTNCVLTKYRLKSDHLDCNGEDYYRNKVRKYMIRK